MNDTHVVPATLEFIIVNGQLNTQPKMIEGNLKCYSSKYTNDKKAKKKKKA